MLVHVVLFVHDDLRVISNVQNGALRVDSCWCGGQLHATGAKQFSLALSLLGFVWTFASVSFGADSRAFKKVATFTVGISEPPNRRVPLLPRLAARIAVRMRPHYPSIGFLCC